ncbi:toll-like receptor 1 [Triplophysa dalaica]|uniref:toll-like receptor 1 n=1 Tax=Triplophysa dalaica TaxID=1582913 RepID=UPI0024DF6E91|nr:toll-like receptor 1 [Triplophysa dalaica]
MEMSGWFLTLYLTCLPSCVVLSMKRIFVNYSSQNLSSVPTDLGSSTEDLDLSLNHIQTLKRQDFHTTPRLHLLNVSWNELQHLDVYTFDSTAALQILDLSHNKLQNLSGQLYLLHAGHLRFLDLSSNLFSVMALGREFVTLEHLRWLGLSAEHIYNTDLTNISNLTLTTLFINASGTELYEKSSLTSVRAERAVIVLSNSHIDGQMAADAFVSFKELQFTNVKNETLFLEDLRRRGSVRTVSLEISQVRSSWKVLTGLVNTVLMSSVQRLSLSDVTITSMNWSSDVILEHTLDHLSVTRASVTTFLFNQEELYDFFINMPARNLSITQTPIVHITCPASVSKIGVLDLSDCALTEKVFSKGPDQECTTLTRLDTLILKANNLRHLKPLTSRIHLMNSLTHADFSQNSLTYTPEQGTCVWPPKITRLDLSSNNFKQNIFTCLPTSVQILLLQNNQITTVPADVPLLDDLSVLDLTANRLLDLPSCLSYPNLQTLLVRSNSLHAPTPDALRTCPRLKTLDASHNPFICTCALRDFSALVDSEATQHPALIVERWPDAYVCSYPESWSNSTLQDFHLPEVSCNAWLLSVSILIPTITLVIAVTLFCNKLDVPWYLKMIWKWTRAKHHALVWQERAKDMEGIRFHAFLSYSQKNSEWVKGQLLPKLENGGLRVCHHERDFVPGKTIVQNILRCVEHSRRSIFVLSSHFVQSEWCHYELYFANHQKVTRGSDSIILLLLEPLPSYLIPSKYCQLKSMMSRRTYLEWPQEGAKQTLFWVNLRAALQANLPIPSERDDQTF